MTVGADALEAGFVTALIDSSSFCDGGLDTGGIGAKDDFRSSINMAIGEEAARANLSVDAEIVDRNYDSRVLHPLWLGLVSFCDGGKG